MGVMNVVFVFVYGEYGQGGLARLVPTTPPVSGGVVVFCILENPYLDACYALCGARNDIDNFMNGYGAQMSQVTLL